MRPGEAPAAPATPEVDPEGVETPPEPTPTPAPAPKKGAKAKRQVPELDTMEVARQAATAATEAAMRAMPREQPKAQPDPLEDLTDEDKHDYEVAQHLAKLDPRFKDAPQIIVGNLRKAEDYASRWEAANPGKQFDPNEDEHNEFFTGLRTPWTASQFQNAAIDMLAEKKTEKLREEQDHRLRGVEAASARMELAPHVDQRFTQTTLGIANLIGDEVGKTLKETGWQGLSDQDPVLSQVLATTMQQMHPFIEAAVHIDDPRIGLNVNDPMHKQWSAVVSQGEQMAMGQRDENGRLFARRADYVRMSPAERAKHWYLTTDHIIQGALEYAADEVQKVTEAQKQQLEKLGYRREGKPSSGSRTTPAPAAPAAPAPAPAQAKPVSPSVGSGAKIDAAAEAPTTKEGLLMQQMSRILDRK